MIVQDVLSSRRVLSLAPEDSVTFAARLMSWAVVKHLPVCDGRTVVGVFSDHDYLRYRSVASVTGENAPVSRFMRRPVVTADPRDALDDAAALMLARRVDCLPIVDPQHQLVGLLVASDILSADLRASVPRMDAGVSIGEVMTRDPLTARPYQPVLEAVALMAERGFKHVPIVDDDGSYVDVVRKLLDLVTSRRQPGWRCSP